MGTVQTTAIANELNGTTCERVFFYKTSREEVLRDTTITSLLNSLPIKTTNRPLDKIHTIKKPSSLRAFCFSLLNKKENVSGCLSDFRSRL